MHHYVTPHITTSSAYHLVYHILFSLRPPTFTHTRMTHPGPRNRYLSHQRAHLTTFVCSCFASFFIVRCISHCTFTHALHMYPKAPTPRTIKYNSLISNSLFTDAYKQIEFSRCLLSYFEVTQRQTLLSQLSQEMPPRSRLWPEKKSAVDWFNTNTHSTMPLSRPGNVPPHAKQEMTRQ